MARITLLAAVAVSLLLVLEPAPAQAAPALGFNEEWTRQDGPWHSPAHATRMMDAARSAGASAARLTIDWSFVQPGGPRDWQLGRLRGLYRDLVARGQRPVLTLVGAPCWAARDICVDRDGDGRRESRPLVHGATPAAIRPSRAGVEAWEAFVARVARELPEARAFEIWNEPNLPQFWGTAHPEAGHGRLAQLVAVAARALRREAPGVPVWVGGVAAPGPSAGLTSPWARYLARVYGHGVAAVSDGFALHPYPDFRRRSLTAADHVATTLGKVDTARLLLWLADPSGSLAVTEFGLPSGLPGGERGQALYLRGALDGLTRRPEVPVALVHRLQDDASASFGLQASAGVFRDAPGSPPKRAVCALSGACHP